MYRPKTGRWVRFPCTSAISNFNRLQSISAYNRIHCYSPKRQIVLGLCLFSEIRVWITGSRIGFRQWVALGLRTVEETRSSLSCGSYEFHYFRPIVLCTLWTETVAQNPIGYFPWTIQVLPIPFLVLNSFTWAADHYEILIKRAVGAQILRNQYS